VLRGVAAGSRYIGERDGRRFVRLGYTCIAISAVTAGLYPVVTLEKQLLNIIGNLV
jgi:hypothetical protein